MSKTSPAPAATAAAGASTGDFTSTSLDVDEGAALEAMVEHKLDSVKVVGANKDPELSGKLAVIQIHMVASQSGATEEGANAPIFVGLNGYGYQIPRGINVKVPVEVLDILDNAIQKSYPTKDGLVIGAMDVPRHAYRVFSRES